MSDDESPPPSAPADPRFPLTVVYCGICGVPPEYCPYGPDWERCRVWIAENCPELMPVEARGGGGGVAKAAEPSATGAAAGAGDGESGGEEDSSASEGGAEDDAEAKRNSKSRRKKKTSAKPDPAKAEVLITIAQRKKHKWTTTISGVESFGLKTKDVSKKLGKRFATGAGIVENTANPTGPEDIELQGDFQDTIVGVLFELFEIPGHKVFKMAGVRKIRLGEAPAGTPAPPQQKAGGGGGGAGGGGGGRGGGGRGGEKAAVPAPAPGGEEELVQSTVDADDI